MGGDWILIWIVGGDCVILRNETVWFLQFVILNIQDMKEEISTKKAPGAIGPYSQAVKAGAFVYVSGQLPINAATGEMPADIKAQTAQSIENIKAILEEAGGSLDNVVKTTVLLADMSLFGPMNEVYGEYFKAVYPARAAFAVKELPKQALVEIEAVAFI